LLLSLSPSDGCLESAVGTGTAASGGPEPDIFECGYADIDTDGRGFTRKPCYLTQQVQRIGNCVVSPDTFVANCPRLNRVSGWTIQHLRFPAFVWVLRALEIERIDGFRSSTACCVAAGLTFPGAWARTAATAHQTQEIPSIWYSLIPSFKTLSSRSQVGLVQVELVRNLRQEQS